MMITYALSALCSSNEIDEVIIVADESWRREIIDDINKVMANKESGDDKIRGFAEPGATRQGSILNGMEAIGIDTIDDADTVLIHDAARPNLTREMLHKCYEALPGHDGVMPTLPMKDTVYISEDGKSITSLIDRSTVFAGQAPELFNFKKYYEANVVLLPDKINTINGATEPAIMANMDVVMIPGDENNIKVTTDVDMSKFTLR